MIPTSIRFTCMQKIYMKKKYQFFTHKLEKARLKHCVKHNAFMEYYSNVEDIYTNIYTELFICDRKLSISLASTTQSCYAFLKNRLYTLHTQNKL